MKKLLLILWMLYPLMDLLRAQTPSDAVIQRETCFERGYDQGSWYLYAEGNYLQTNGDVDALKGRAGIVQDRNAVHYTFNPAKIDGAD